MTPTTDMNDMNKNFLRSNLLDVRQDLSNLANTNHNTHVLITEWLFKLDEMCCELDDSLYNVEHEFDDLKKQIHGWVEDYNNLCDQAHYTATSVESILETIEDIQKRLDSREKYLGEQREQFQANMWLYTILYFFALGINIGMFLYLLFTPV